jgi:hypothetical protein
MDAKERLQVILETLSGRLRVNEAAARLGVTPQRFHTLRQEAMQAALDALAPKPAGRPRRTPTAAQERLEALWQENARLRHELAASQLREEVALVLPGHAQAGEKKSQASAAPRGRRGRRRR